MIFVTLKCPSCSALNDVNLLPEDILDNGEVAFTCIACDRTVVASAVGELLRALFQGKVAG